MTLAPATSAPAEDPPYLNPRLGVDQRVADLLGRMTLEEKVGQLNQKLYGWKCSRKTADGFELTDDLKREVRAMKGLGVLYGLFRADPWSGASWGLGIGPDQRAKVANQVQRYVIEHSRLGIPALLSEECPHGHQALGGTLLPTNLGAGCSWNPDLLQRAASTIAAEIRHSGAHLGLTSALDILRDPRWGRSEECYGEDPCLSAAMTAAVTRGMQGTSVDQLANGDHLVIILKHFCAQGAAEGGHNAAAAVIGPRELREIHLPAMHAGAQAGALGLMAAYNEIDGVPCCGNPKLLNDMLRDEWHFGGIVMSDGGAIDNLQRQTGSIRAAGIMALRAGVDVGLWDQGFRTLTQSVHDGRLAQADVDRACARVLKIKFLMGLFEHPYVEENPARVEADRAAANVANLNLARETLVLLKNDHSLLPLSKDLRRIAVIGPNADSVYGQLGDYTAQQKEGETITILRGVRDLLANGARVDYAPGCRIGGDDRSGFADAIAKAKAAQVAIVVLGTSSERRFKDMPPSPGVATPSEHEEDMNCGESHDVANIQLGGVQKELAEAIVRTGTPTVIVLVQGRPSAIPWIAEHCPAILCAWYPGQQGGRAVAQALFGDVNPSGRLSVSIARSSMQLPVYYDHKFAGDADYRDMSGKPLYPFGFGLSYTTFALANLQLDADTAKAADIEGGGAIQVSVDVKNTGARAGAEVVQLYIHGQVSSITRRVKELKAFSKVELKPGESRTVKFKLGKNELAVWNPAMRFTAEPGITQIMVGAGDGATLTKMLTLE